MSVGAIDMDEYNVIKDSNAFSYKYEGLLHSEGEIKDIDGNVIETLETYYIIA